MKRKADRWLMVLVLLLTLWGLVMVYSSSWTIGQMVLGKDSVFFVERQIVKAVAGLFLMFLLSMIPLRLLRDKLSFVGWWITVGFLTLLVAIRLLSGKSSPVRWVPLWGSMVQPSEFARIALIVVLAAVLAKAVIPPQTKDLFKALAITILTAGLVAAQPSLSVSVVLCLTGFCILFLAGGGWVWLGGLIAGMSGVTCFLLVGYQEKRWTTFVEAIRGILQGDILAAPNDQVQQALIALGSGGFLGTGVGRGLQKFKFLAQPHTDFILAVHGEETGFLGVIILLGLEALVVWRIFAIAIATRDSFSRLLCFGVGLQIGLLVLIHTAVNFGVGPTTGVPLPFISYGGSALVANLVGVGLVLAVSRQGIQTPKKEPLDMGLSRWRKR